MTPSRAAIHVRDQFQDADPDDLVLLEDLLGIRDAATRTARCRPDAQRRRLTALINLPRRWPAPRPTMVYVIEDAHWIDEVSESMLADFSRGGPPDPGADADHLPA